MQDPEKKKKPVDDKKQKDRIQNGNTEKYYKTHLADFAYLESHGYKIYKELGRGGYGVVYQACRITKSGHIDKSKKFAIKINFLTVTPELIYSEIAFLQIVKDQSHTPQLVDLFIQNDKIHIILNYFKYKPFISFFSSFTLQDIKYYLYELLTSIKVLKNLGIYHRDIKPGNFLYNPEQRKGILIDYGLSELDQDFFHRLQKQEKDKDAQRIELYKNIIKCSKIVGTNKIGTESFMPIESILRYKQQSYSVDIWPVGVIFLQFVLRKYNIFNNVRMMNKPTDVKNYYHITFLMELADIYGTDLVNKQCEKFGYKVTFPKDLPTKSKNLREFITIQGFDEVAENLLQRLLCLDHEKRISVEDALAHPFFQDIVQNAGAPCNPSFNNLGNQSSNSSTNGNNANVHLGVNGINKLGANQIFSAPQKHQNHHLQGSHQNLNSTNNVNNSNPGNNNGFPGNNNSGIAVKGQGISQHQTQGLQPHHQSQGLQYSFEVKHHPFHNVQHQQH